MTTLILLLLLADMLERRMGLITRWVGKAKAAGTAVKDAAKDDAGKATE